MTGNPVGLVEFLTQRLDEESRSTFELVPYECEPGCCAPAGFVGHKCLICRETSFGGTVEAITEICREHEETIHRRSYVLQDIAAKRRIIELHHPDPAKADTWYWLQRECAECKGGWHKWLPDKLPTDIGPEQGCRTLRLLAAPFSSHPNWQPEWSDE